MEPLRLRLVLAGIILSGFCAGKLDSRPTQMQPDAKRVHEIEVALLEHHYITPGNWTWPYLQEVCRRIALEHGWQTHHAPDARVLILLGLGNPHSNPDVLDWKPSQLEQ